MGVMSNCPDCGKPMEKGFLGSESIFSEVRWFEEKNTFGTGGEGLGSRGRLMTYLEGYRCKECKTLIMQH